MKMIEETVRHIYSLLLSQKYNDLVIFTNGIRMTSDEIKESIIEYGYQLIPYPEKIELDIVEVDDRNPKEWSVIAPIFTAQEGCSDLSIELSVIDNNKSIYTAQLDNIRVR